MLAIARWVVFVPLAAVAALVAGELLTLAGNQVNAFVGIASGGGAIGACFVIVGLWAAPRRTRIVQLGLVGVAVLAGAVSMIGSLTSQGQRLNAFAGVACIIGAMVFAIKKLGTAFNVAGFAGFIAAGIWEFVLLWSVGYQWLYPHAGVLTIPLLILAGPFVLPFAPFYLAFAKGWWLPLEVGLGGTLLSTLLLVVAGRLESTKTDPNVSG